MINFLDNIALKISLELAKLLVKAKIKPISVTLFRFIIAAPLSWLFFSRGEYIYNVIGLFTYMALALLDWVDGEMAQLYKLPRETAPFGKLIDHMSDRVLMMIVLGSLLFAGLTKSNNQLWITVTILYYSSFFYLTSLIYDFEKMFKLDFLKFPKIERSMFRINSSPNLIDKVLYNMLYVHNNSITRICFTHNFILIFGILTNQILISFIFITSMHMLRSAGVFFIMYKTLKHEESNSALVKVLRKYKTF